MPAVNTWPFSGDLDLHYSGMLWWLMVELGADMLSNHDINSLQIMTSPMVMKSPSITGPLIKYGKLSSAEERIRSIRVSLCTLIFLSFCLLWTFCQLHGLFLIYLFDFEHQIYYKCLIFFILHISLNFISLLHISIGS